MNVVQAHAQERSALRETRSELARADFHLGTALRLLEEHTSQEKWGEEARALFGRTLALRSEIEELVGS